MDSQKNKAKIENPRDKAGIVSSYFYLWMWKVFRSGLKKELEIEDLYEPLKEHQSEHVGDMFEKSWQNEVTSKKKPYLARAIAKCYIWRFMFYGLFEGIMELIFRIAQPLCLGQLILYFEPSSSNVTKNEAYLYAAAVVLCSIVFVFVRQPFILGMTHLGMKIRVGVCALIYRKSLRLTQHALNKCTVGHIMNLMSNDSGHFDYSLLQVHYLWIAPVQTVIVGYLTWRNIGVSALVGMSVTLIFIPLQGFLSRKIANLRLETAVKTDKRVELMDEILYGIQVIKMYTWEKPFSKLIGEARRNEVGKLRMASYLRAVVFSFEMFATRLSLFLAILTYILLGNYITAEKVFVVSSYFNILKLTVTDFLPRGVVYGSEALVSAKRIEEFLLLDEVKSEEAKPMSQYTNNGFRADELDEVKESAGREPYIICKNVTAKWLTESDDVLLHNIDFSIQSPQLVSIIGAVGTGKSSLLHVLLGELLPSSGTVEIEGRISYCPQESWVFAGSVRNNILFGETYNSDRYNRVIQVCALQRDFELFPHGDMTIVGERGVSLSGGQKARINLARAVYREADIYILDDPLSAVDAHVGKQLFSECICSYLKDKICILVTHQLQYLSSVDNIIVLNNGAIESQGTFQMLQKSGLNFVKYLRKDSVPPEDNIDDDNVIQEKCVENNSNTKFTDKTDSKPEPKTINEMRTRGKVGFKPYKEYFSAGGNHFQVFLMFSFVLIAQALTSGSDYWLSYWTGVESKRNSNTSEINEETHFIDMDTCVEIFAGLTGGAILIIFLRSFFFFYFCTESSKNLHNKMFDSVISTCVKFFHENHSGQILNRFSKDLGDIDEMIPLALLDVLQIGLYILGIFILVAVINYWILIVTIIVLIIFYFLRLLYIPTSRNSKRLEGVTRSPVYSHLNTSLQGLVIIRSFGAQNMLQTVFNEHQDSHSSAFYLSMVSSRAFALWLDSVCILYITCVAFSFLVIDAARVGGDIGLAITQAIGLTGWFEWGITQSAELETLMTSVERILEYIGLKSESANFESQVSNSTLTSVVDTSKRIWPSHGQIVFSHLYLRYDESEPPVLKDLNFTIYPHEKIGIVGRTGAGKSSLLSALFRTTALEGSIMIDGIDTSMISLNELRRNISIIPQEPFLFSGSLYYNIDPFHEFSEDDIWSALSEVELKATVSESPSGLNQQVSKGGKNFSVGQRQLICLARAIVRNNKILVMDEATANVDPQTDDFIQRTIKHKFSDCTVITIAHRLMTVVESDRVMVMDAGTIVEFDHPYLLMQNENSYLYSLVQETGKAMADSFYKKSKESYFKTNPANT